MSISTTQELPNRVSSTANTAVIGSTTGVDANDLVRLVHDGSHFAYFHGSGTNTLSVPDEAALDITGDIDIRVEVELPDYSTGSAQSVLAKTNLSSARSYVLDFNATGNPRLLWSVTGSSDTVAAATAAVTTVVSDGDKVWVRATLDVDNGASGYDVTFYTSTDGSTWNQLGAVVTGGAPTSIFASTTVVRLGASATSSNPLTGIVHRAQIYDGIAGTLVLDINPAVDIDTSSDPDAGQSSFTATTGQTVTVNRATSGVLTAVVTRSVMLFDGTADYVQLPVEDTPSFTKTTGKHTVVVAWRRWIASATWERLVSFESGGNDGIYLGYNNTDKVACFCGDGSAVAAVQPGGYTLGEIVVSGYVVDDGTMSIFQDGTTLVSTSLSTISTEPTFGNGRIGSQGYAVGALPDGLEVFAHLSFDGVALTQDQLDALAARIRNGDYL